MKTIILAPIIGYLAASGAATDWGPMCSKKYPSAVNAIGKFCQNQNLVVPSDYAKHGMDGFNTQSHIKTTGNCKPAQWVPQHYCMQQFFQMCAQGGAHGGSKRKYGRNGCQHWEIHYSDHTGAQM